MRAVAVALAVALSFVSGAHALSSAVTRNAPGLALAVWPSNGHAIEGLAYDGFANRIREELNKAGAANLEQDTQPISDNAMAAIGDKELREYALLASSDAKLAMSKEPLVSKAHTILAFSEKDATTRRDLINLASLLTRRDLPLQTLVFQSRTKAKDYAGTMEVLDQILRVHPERSAEFFPLLAQALKQEAAIPAFQGLLANPVPWRDGFLMYAVQDPVSARNLAIVRESVSFSNPDFDRSLILNLFASGEQNTATRLYRQISRNRLGSGDANWLADYPPFDWTFANEAGLRAQPSRDGQSLEFIIEPGRGGIFASRVIEAPKGKFEITMQQSSVSTSAANNLKVTLTCNNQSSTFIEMDWVAGDQRSEVQAPADCSHVTLSLSGRVWSGGTAVSGSVASVAVSAR